MYGGNSSATADRDSTTTAQRPLSIAAVAAAVTRP